MRLKAVAGKFFHKTRYTRGENNLWEHEQLALCKKEIMRFTWSLYLTSIKDYPHEWNPTWKLTRDLNCIMQAKEKSLSFGSGFPRSTAASVQGSLAIPSVTFLWDSDATTAPRGSLSLCFRECNKNPCIVTNLAPFIFKKSSRSFFFLTEKTDPERPWKWMSTLLQDLDLDHLHRAIEVSPEGRARWEIMF